MRVTLTRLGERAYESHVLREDGTRYRVGGVGLKFAVPHDMAHFAIEGALGLRRGFWGSIAEGAVFKSMTHVDGRRRPHAGRRSSEVLKANAVTISEAEMLVAVVNNALERRPSNQEHAVRAALKTRNLAPRGREHAREFTSEQIARACSAWNEMLEIWEALPIGGHVELHWPPK